MPVRFLVPVTFLAASCLAANVTIPGGTLTLPGTSTTGASFTFTGTLTQADTINFVQTGSPCLQFSNNTYCVNGAGVITVAGTSPVGAATSFSGTIGGTTATWTYGALLLSISGVGTVQVFPANASNGLGSGSPPVSLTLPVTAFSALGFSNFSVSNPTITLIIADTFYGDNTNQFVLTQGGAAPPPVPIPGSLLLSLTGILMLASLYLWLRRASA